jgi:SAM-dependent methyltransferase
MLRAARYRLARGMMKHMAPQDSVRLGGHNPHHRAFVGAKEKYDIMAAVQFNLLTSLGLREHHSLLDIGCGSLRAGRLFIPYLLPGNYYGIEPEEWLVQEGIKSELGNELIELKRPSFAYDNDFNLGVFNRTFDYLIAQSIFTHSAKPQIAKCLASAKQVMGPGSLFVANYIHGEKDYEGKHWVYPECVPYTEATMRGLVTEQGLGFSPFAYHHPGGATWILIFPPNASAFEGPRPAPGPPTSGRPRCSAL